MALVNTNSDDVVDANHTIDAPMTRKMTITALKPSMDVVYYFLCERVYFDGFVLLFFSAC